LNGTIAYIGIGSNLGESLKNCRKAIEKLSCVEGIKLLTASSFYKTEPVGIEDQDFFIRREEDEKAQHPGRYYRET